MKRISMYVFTIVLTFALTAMLARVAAHHSHFVGSTVRNPTDAASRDGLFQGRLDAERGRKQHLASGRWNLDADRRLFVSGYLQEGRGFRWRRVNAHDGKVLCIHPNSAAVEEFVASARLDGKNV